MAKLDKAITLARLSSALLKVKSYVDGVVAELASNVSSIMGDVSSSIDTLETQMKDKADIAYATCSTAADTVEKVATITGSNNWELKVGSLITVKFTATNTATAPTLNVNGTGAYPIYYNASEYTSASSYGGYANRHITYQFSGTHWVFISWSYDSNSDTKVEQSAAITTAGEYPVLLAYSTSTSKVTNTVKKTSSLKYNPSTKVLTAPTFKGDLTGNADSADKLNSNAGSATQPVFFQNGVPVETTHTLGASVPSDAKFTDTVYTHPSHTAKSSGLYKLTIDSLGHVTGATAVTKSDITGLGIPAQDTVYTHPAYTNRSSGLYKITVDSTGHVSAVSAVTKSDITGLGIPAQDTVYTHPSHTAKSSGLYKITVDSTGHVSAVTAVTKSDITGLGIPAQDTVYTHPAYTAKSSGLYKITVDATGHVSAATAVTKSDITGLGIAASDHSHTSKDWGKIAVPLSGWSSSATNGWFTNQVTVSGMTASHYPAVNVEYTSAGTVDSEATAFAMVKEIETFAGYIILRATEKPSIDFNIRLIGA